MLAPWSECTDSALWLRATVSGFVIAAMLGACGDEPAPAATSVSLPSVSASDLLEALPSNVDGYVDLGEMDPAGFESMVEKNIEQTFIRRLRQSQCIIQLATGQQPSVRGDGSAVKLQPYTAVETERGTGVGAFTHWVPPE